VRFHALQQLGESERGRGQHSQSGVLLANQMRVIYIQPAVNHKPNVNNGFVFMDEDSNVVMLNASRLVMLKLFL